MALFDRNDNRGYGYRDDLDRDRGPGFVDRAQHAVRRGWDRVENAFEGPNPQRGRDYGYGGGMGRGWNAGSRPMDREGGLHGRNSWSDGAWTADAADRADREWNLGNRGRPDVDRDDTTPFQAGWRAGGMGMGRGPDGDRGWNAGGYNRYDRGFMGGSHRGGGFLDRAQNAVRRGWDRVEERLDGDRGDMHLGGRSMRGGYDRDWHQPSDVRAYRDEDGNYGLEHVGGMRGSAGTNRYGSDYGRGGMLGRGGTDYDRGYTGRGTPDRYDENYRGSRDWF